MLGDSSGLDPGPFLPAIDSFAGNEDTWTNPTTFGSLMSTVPSPGAPIATELLLSTTPLVPTSLATTSIVVGANAPQAGAVFVVCSPEVFSEGIKWVLGFIKEHFPAAYVIISGVRTMVKNYLVIHGPYAKQDVDSFCVQAMAQVLMTANSAGQPPERGRNKCR